MRLRTKLVLTATVLTFAIVLVLSVVFLGELLRQRIVQTSAANDVLAKVVLLATRQAVETGLRAHPAVPDESSPDTDTALQMAVIDALRSSDELATAMNGIVRYSPTVEDVSVTDAHGLTIVSTDPDAVNQRAAYRESFGRVLDAGLFEQVRDVFGRPRVLDVAEPLARNGMPFLVVHVGVQSTFLRFVGENAYEPWLKAALEFVLLAIVASAAIAALLSALALRPLQAFGEQLEQLTLANSLDKSGQPLLLAAASRRADPVGRVSMTIDRLGREIRTREEGYLALQASVHQMLDTLRDGVLLFAADRRAVMVSDAVERFLDQGLAGQATNATQSMVGMTLEQIFPASTVLGAAIDAAFERDAPVAAETVTLEDGRQVQISLDRIGESERRGTEQQMGTLLTLRDTASAQELQQELEVSRRLAAIGRLSANVGHEVKNPINAMVVHLELLRGKLASANVDRASAQRHVEILADEMHRLDRVVETLADFSRPMNLELHEQDMRGVVERTVELAQAELIQQGVTIETALPAAPVTVRVDAEVIRQALLNLLLNAMQAMPDGGVVRIALRREARYAVVEIADNGVGIPDSVLPRIFDLYFTTKPRGSGIGLAMTYRILQLHGGALEVRSNADANAAERGTTFTMHLPLSAGRSTAIVADTMRFGEKV